MRTSWSGSKRARQARPDQNPQWICKNTRDPRSKRLRWSFADHEFQIGILSEAAAHVVVRKCSPRWVCIRAESRLTLAVCYMRDLTGIYVLPTVSCRSSPLTG